MKKTLYSSLGHIGVTQRYGDNNKPIQGSLSNDQDSIEIKSVFFVAQFSKKIISPTFSRSKSWVLQVKPFTSTGSLCHGLLVLDLLWCCVSNSEPMVGWFRGALWTLEELHNNFNFIVKCVNNLGRRL